MEPTTVAIEIPREVLNTTHMSRDDLRVELAVYLFQQGKLSFGKARETAGLSPWEFQQILGLRRIPVHYDLQDYEDDLATLRALGRR